VKPHCRQYYAGHPTLTIGSGGTVVAQSGVIIQGVNSTLNIGTLGHGTMHPHHPERGLD